MDINAEVSTQLSLIDVLLSNLDKTIAPCTNVKNEKKEEETQNAMPDSTTNNDKNNSSAFNCGDDVLVANKDGRYYLGTIVELSDVYSNDAQCLVKFGDGTHAWASLASLKLLSAPAADDGRIMCVVCKRRDGPAAPHCANAIVPCDMCGRGYHAKCHSPPVDVRINGASWHCKRCVEQRFRVAAAENRALRRADPFRLKQAARRPPHDLIPPCHTASMPSTTACELGKEQTEAHCYCGEKSDWLAQMLMCCRCSRWFHQRCVSSLQYPLYAGDKLYIFACSKCNSGAEYLRRLELCWLDLAHLALYNLTAYNAPNYFDLDDVIMPYIMDNWHALQLPEKMWRTPVSERRGRILTALTSSRKRFKCGREMKKRATIWGLRLRRPPPPPAALAHLAQIKKGEQLTDELVREYAPRLKFLCRAPSPQNVDRQLEDSLQPSSSYNQRMIVPVDGHWLNLMMGKRFHENLNNSNSENDSTCSYESAKPSEADDPPTAVSSTALTSEAKDHKVDRLAQVPETTTNESSPVPSPNTAKQCSVKTEHATDTPKEKVDESKNSISIKTHSARIATMNMEVSKLSTKNIIEHSKIMSLQHMDTSPTFPTLVHEVESSGDETSSRGTLDAIIPPLKDFQGKNNPFLMQNSYPSKKLSAAKNQNGKNVNSRFSLPVQFNQMGTLVKPLKRKLSEKDIVIGPNGEVKRRKYRRPRKHLQTQHQGNLNKSCPLPEETSRTVRTASENGEVPLPAPRVNNANLHGRRLRQRQEKNYYENARRSTNNNTATINSVKSLQLSPHKVNGSAVEVDQRQLSELKSSVQSYFRVGQTFSVLARRNCPNQLPAYLIQWDSNATCGTT